MRVTLLAVIVALCAFATPSFANNDNAVFEGRASLDTRADGERAFRDREDDRSQARVDEDDERPAISSKKRRGSRGSWAKNTRHMDEKRAVFSEKPSGRAAAAVQLAERYIGTNPTKMRALWCANFVGMIEKKAGRAGSGSNFARSYLSYGKKVSSPQPGDIAILARGKSGRSGHVGYFVGWAGNGKAILISGNSRGGKVSKGQYSAARVIGWRRPA
jgi:uncharacterized protein (TIGR02594 family)